MKELSFNRQDELVFGVYDGYLVTIADQDGGASICIDISLSDTADIDREKIRSFIEANARQYSIRRAEVKNTEVYLLFESSLSAFAKLRDFFYLFIRLLTSISIPGAAVCTNCGQPITALSIISINGRLHSCDRECAKYLLGTARNDKNPTVRKVYFAAGFVGALFGAVFGTVPLVILSRIGISALWSGIAIGLFAKGGYEFFGGKRCVAKAVALPLLSLLAAVPAVFLYYCYTLSSMWLSRNYIFQFREVIQEVFETVKTTPSLQRSMVTSTLIAFAFAVIGILVFARLKKSGAEHSVYIVS